jgi:tripartite-type tricarboxylate transporter receptor subunit TctC
VATVGINSVAGLASAGLPNVPTIKDFGHEELLTVATSRFVVGAPPGVPPEIADTLRKAFDQACRDPEFIKKIEQVTKYRMRPTDFVGAEKIVNDSIKVVGKYKSMNLERSG